MSVDTLPKPLIELVSDFNIDLFARYFALCSEDSFEIRPSPYGQVFQSLYDTTDQSIAKSQRYSLVWTRPQSVIPSFAKLIQGEFVAFETLDAEFETFIEAVRQYSKQRTAIFIVTWLRDYNDANLGLQEWSSETGLSYILAKLNIKLADAVPSIPGVYLLDATPWTNGLYPSTLRSKLWCSIKVPFENKVFERASEDVFAAIQAILGLSRKLIILDLDNTLWGGIVGDDGWENLELGGHNWRGEAFVAFQRSLYALSLRGIQLAIVSKNEAATALHAIESHPDMVLKIQHFAGWKINWQDKAQNILELTQELKLGLQSVVFLDDSPAERQRVREALPDVLVPDLPEDPSGYVPTLHSLTCFNATHTTSEDKKRTEMYVAERNRQASAQLATSMDDWLRNLDLIMEVDVFSPREQARIVQLLNKTNQLNLRTRRLSEQELLLWLSENNHALCSVRVRDRFGDYGLTGILSFETEETTCHIVDYLLSCRVMGRGVESALLHIASRFGHWKGCSKLELNLLPTAKNTPLQQALLASQLQQGAENCFTWKLGEPYPLPDYIALRSGLEWLTDNKEPL